MLFRGAAFLTIYQIPVSSAKLFFLLLKEHWLLATQTELAPHYISANSVHRKKKEQSIKNSCVSPADEQHKKWQFAVVQKLMIR